MSNFRTAGLRARRGSELAFALKEVLVILAVIVVLACVVLVAWQKAAGRSRAICCNCNLKQVGLGFRTWALDHTQLYPMAVSTNFGGTLEYLATSEVFRHFQVLSNELSTPIILVCPQDSRQPAKAFDPGFNNANLSYFIGVVSNSDNPQMFLSGDHNVTGGTRQTNGMLEITTNDVPSWGTDIHNGWGNIGLADGSVQQLNTLRLREAIRWTGSTTNRLVMP
jgi:prepilin-type processing-associated H-X9-DG protein